MADSKPLNPLPEAVLVATIGTSGKSSRTKLFVDKIRTIITKNRIEDVPVVVIAIAGKSRRGKSYLLSVMIAYLEHISKSPKQPFQPSSADISGMKWTSGRSAVTKGIWLWEKPYIIKSGRLSKVAVLLMDTQGICDDTHSAEAMVDSQIIYTTLSMATIYIHNVNNDFQMPEKKVYQICKSFSEVCGDEDEKPLFNSFTLLIRDWTEDENYGSRTCIFREELEKAMVNEEASKIMTGIDRLFKNKTAWAFPVPSKALQTSKGSLPLTEAGTKFQNCVLKFLQALFSPDGEYNSHMDCALTGKRFLEKLVELSERLQRFPHLTSDADQLKDFFLSKAYDSAIQIFENSLRGAQELDSICAVNNHLQASEKYAINYFKTQVQKYKPQEESCSCYLDKLLKLFGKEKKSLISSTKLKMEERRRKTVEADFKQFKMVAGTVGVAATGIAGAAWLGVPAATAGAADLGTAAAAGKMAVSAVCSTMQNAGMRVLGTTAAMKEILPEIGGVCLNFVAQRLRRKNCLESMKSEPFTHNFDDYEDHKSFTSKRDIDLPDSTASVNPNPEDESGWGDGKKFIH